MIPNKQSILHDQAEKETRDQAPSKNYTNEKKKTTTVHERPKKLCDFFYQQNIQTKILHD